ncbi:ParB/Srx family N-terminal domain-containing protein [Mesorhizobium muleiense]|uniref:ParB-like nuclease domain-containing protein n=1 Tax=Mesorhizobium muleiense TaxID=1004279 RepID=A0A1G8LDD3_9HYPH|nr:ParB/Srx family N-terminal domain-containing protein [Mesorhizobium muleiense]MCF6100351.1 ParB/Srx family N-terminal domain-containing protein [Mesorhizobium muleiense]SDI53681.1 hypothetical protein SAMN05428953_102212 [Mesorhizobium muleiense]
MSWRDHIRVHPAADLFPMMSEAELRELAADIKANDLRLPVIIWHDDDGTEWLLDGRNRLDALELIGEKLITPDGKLSVYDYHTDKADRGDPYAYVISLNIKRRHLTAEQKRDLIAKLLKAGPERSNRQIAGVVKASHVTVGKVREEMEATGQVDQLTKTVGADGKARTRDRHKPGHAKRNAASILSVQDVLAKSLYGKAQLPSRPTVLITAPDEPPPEPANVVRLVDTLPEQPKRPPVNLSQYTTLADAMAIWNRLSKEDARQFIQNIRLHPKFPGDLFTSRPMPPGGRLQ